MKFYVVIDTNVLISAVLKHHSNPGAIMEFIKDGTIIPLINDKIIAEYKDVLLRPKFKFTAEYVDELLSAITKEALIIKEDHIDIDLPDEKDRVFYEVTMKSNEDRDSMLVTGNMKHFPIEPFIVTPKELCDIIVKAMGEA